MKIILDPVLEKLDVYGKNGIAISDGGDKIIKVKLIWCVFDLVV